MTIDYTINIGSLIEVASIIIGGFIALITMRETIKNLKDDMTDMKLEIKKVGEVLIQLAVADTRLTNLENDLRELKHGEGFVFPFVKGKPKDI